MRSLCAGCLGVAMARDSVFGKVFERQDERQDAFFAASFCRVCVSAGFDRTRDARQRRRHHFIARCRLFTAFHQRYCCVSPSNINMISTHGCLIREIVCYTVFPSKIFVRSDTGPSIAMPTAHVDAHKLSNRFQQTNSQLYFYLSNLTNPFRRNQLQLSILSRSQLCPAQRRSSRRASQETGTDWREVSFSD